MNFFTQSPAEQLVEIMNRIYSAGMTTTSGGNLSLMDSRGHIWITPSGVDKGALRPEDICEVAPDGTVTGPHKPSIELPFHRLVYSVRPEIGAVVHAHPPELVACSMARKLPDLSAFPDIGAVCMEMAEYALPGSLVLGEIIAKKFAGGCDAVLMENHGVCACAENLLAAYHRLETLERTAHTLRLAARIPADTADMGDRADTSRPAAQSAAPHPSDTPERLISFIRRALAHGFISASQGAFSMRLPGDRFLITPHGADRAYIEASDMVTVSGGVPERGTPSNSAELHRAVYARHPDVCTVITARPVAAMAFAVRAAALDSRTIPESYIVLRNVAAAPRGLSADALAARISRSSPTLLHQATQILITASSLLGAFDRMEVLEATAKSVIAARELGGIVRIDDSAIDDIDRAFNITP